MFHLCFIRGPFDVVLKDEPLELDLRSAKIDEHAHLHTGGLEFIQKLRLIVGTIGFGDLELDDDAIVNPKIRLRNDRKITSSFPF